MNKDTAHTMERLQMKLSDLATQYRSAAAGSDAHYKALEAYYNTFQELIVLNGGEIPGLDPDAELPDRLMPKAYVDYWLNGGSSK